MKRFACILLVILLLSGCGTKPPAQTPAPTTAPMTPTNPVEEVDPMTMDLTDRFVAAAGEKLPASQTYVFKNTDIPDLTTKDLVLLTLEVKAESGVKKLGVAFYQGGTQAEDTYYVPSQWTRIVLTSDPESTPVGVKLDAEDGILLRKVTVQNKKSATPEEVGHLLGQFVVDSYEKLELSETGAGAGRTTDLVKSGDYIYSIGNGSFTVTDVRDPNAPKVLGKLDGLGNTRQIALCESGTDVMVTARGYGAYVIDASDPKVPRIRACYDTVEMGTGICISGSYAYISNRQYGVEVVDLTDLDHPTFVRVISTGEVQSAQVYDGKLYCGLYGEHRVDIYDLTDPEFPRVGQVQLSGRGDGMAVAESGDRVLLYAATGHHSVSKLSSKTPVTDPRYGQGNGLDIYDVTDPANPRWLSTVRAEGRFYHSMHDYWEAHVSEADGHRYAHVVSTYNGLYIYNVDDPTDPKRVAHITVPIAKASANYSLYKTSIRTILFPFDKYKEIQSPTGALVCEDGVLYMAGVLTDLHVVKMEQLGTGLKPKSGQLQIPAAELGSAYPRFDPEGQVHGVITDGTRLYAACGTDGIAVLDKNLVLQAAYPTEGTCYDVQLFDGILYAAEGRAGLAAYDAASMELLWRYAPEKKVIKQVRLSPKGRFALLHSGDTEASVVRLEDRAEVYSRRTNSQMYHHNISGVIGGRYMCFWAQATNEVWLDFGPEDDYMVPTEVVEYVSRTHMLGGVTDYKGMALNMTGSGYLVYDPMKDPEALTAYSSVSGCTGKPTVYGDLLIVTHRIKGMLYFADISDPERPSSKGEIQLSGNPDIVLVAFGGVYVPCGNAGLVRIPLP